MTARNSFVLPLVGAFFALALATLIGCASQAPHRNPANPVPPEAIDSREGYYQSTESLGGGMRMEPVALPAFRPARAGGEPVAVESSVRNLLALAGVDPVATNVTVRNGWVTVEGSASDAVDREQLMRAIANTQGVRAVADELRLVSAASDEHLATAESPITSWFDWLAGPLAMILATAALVALYIEFRVIPKIASTRGWANTQANNEPERTSIATPAALAAQTPAKTEEESAAKRAA